MRIFTYIFLFLLSICLSSQILNAQENATWQYVEGTNVNGEKLIQDGSVDDGISITENILFSEEDGYIEAQISTTQSILMFGLTTGHESIEESEFSNDLEYSFYQNGTSLQIYERGNYISSHGTCQVDDYLKIERIGNTITYYHNNIIVRTTSTEPAMLRGQVSLFSQLAEVDKIKVTFGEALEADAQLDGNLSPQVNGGEPPYTYKWSNGSTASSLTSLSKGKYSVTITDTEGEKFIQTYWVGDDIQWANSSTNGLKKVASQIVKKSENGWLKYEVPSWNSLTEGEQSNNYLIIGLSEDNDTENLTEVQHGIFIQGNKVYLIENSIIKGYYGNISNSNHTKFRVEKNGSQITYYKDEIELAFSKINANKDYFIKGGYESGGNPLPIVEGIFNVQLSGGEADENENKNWVHTKIYDGTGSDYNDVISEQRTYFDELGRPQQQQFKSFQNQEILAVEPMYDALGRQVGGTMVAPTDRANAQIKYKNNFFLNQSGQKYSFEDYDKQNIYNVANNTSGAIDNPNKVGTQSGTVGWYYSNNNNKEPYVATTDLPYSRVEYYPDGSVKRMSGVGEHHKMGSGNETRVYNFAPSTELDFLYGHKRSYEVVDNDNNPLEPIAKSIGQRVKAFKTIVVGSEGVETVSFKSASGLLLATAVSGSPDGFTCTPQTAHYTMIGEGTRSANIHVPAMFKNSLKFFLPHPTYWQNNNNYINFYITDLNTYEVLREGVDYNLSYNSTEVSVSFLGSHNSTTGFYKVSFDFTEDFELYWKQQLALLSKVHEDRPNITVECQTDYSDWTLYYYNDRGQVVKEVAPLGIDCSYDAGAAVVTTNPSNIPSLINYNTWQPNQELRNVSIPATSTYNSRTLETELIPTVLTHYPPGLDSDIDNHFGYIPSEDIYTLNGGSTNNSNPIQNLLTYTFEFEYIGRKSGQADVVLNQTIISAHLKRDVNGLLLYTSLPQYLYNFSDTELNDYDEVVLKLINISHSLGASYDLSDNTNIVGKLIRKIDISYYENLSVQQNTEIPHKYYNTYYYDDFGRLIAEQTVDEGKTEFIYNDEHQLRFSQDAKQRANSEFSYINYDKLGRIVEAGIGNERASSVAGVNTLDFPEGYYDATIPPSTAVNGISNLAHPSMADALDGLDDSQCDNQTYILYDQSDLTDGVIMPNYTQAHLAGRVAKTWNDNNVTYYSYNHRGEITFTVQDISKLGNKTMDYEYDFFGRMIKSTYQLKTNEEFSHFYTYNIDGQLLRVETQDGTDPLLQHTEYDYYLHGPLKRTELGDNLQGIDYTYTLAGALKSINHPSLAEIAPNNNPFDPGEDGYSGHNFGFSKDVFGMTIDYHKEDYERQNTFINYGGKVSSEPTPTQHHDGRISSIRWNTAGANDAGNGLHNAYRYTYDWKGQLKTAKYGIYQHNSSINATLGTSATNNGFGSIQPMDKYKVEGLTYDKNGNILSLQRYDKDGILMDDLSYTYENTNNGFSKNTNKLNRVIDAAGFKNYEDVSTQVVDNYEYSVSGEIVIDREKDITINYHANGKVEEVKNQTTGKVKVSYIYNERGERLTKTTHDANGNAITTTHYVREITGSVVAIYDEEVANNKPPKLNEIPIAGVGVFYATSRQYVYQITDHLGNVRATLDREKLSTGEAEVLAYTDYYPFGMTMAGRTSYSGEQYRYGYQGQELDSEVGGAGFYAFELRNYDPRLGKWLSADPYRQHWSPFLAMSNNPISFIDPDGGYAYDDAGPEWFMNEGITYLIDGMVASEYEVRMYSSDEIDVEYHGRTGYEGNYADSKGNIYRDRGQLRSQTFDRGCGCMYNNFEGFVGTGYVTGYDDFRSYAQSRITIIVFEETEDIFATYMDNRGAGYYYQEWDLDLSNKDYPRYIPATGETSTFKISNISGGSYSIAMDVTEAKYNERHGAFLQTINLRIDGTETSSTFGGGVGPIVVEGNNTNVGAGADYALTVVNKSEIYYDTQRDDNGNVIYKNRNLNLRSYLTSNDIMKNSDGEYILRNTVKRNASLFVDGPYSAAVRLKISENVIFLISIDSITTNLLPPPTTDIQIRSRKD